MTDTESMFQAPELPSVCPVCGAYSLSPDANVSTLLAVCDVLVMKALEKMGNYILRSRSRGSYLELQGRPNTVVHTLWPPTDAIVGRSLRGAWDVVPAILENHGACCHYEPSQVTDALDTYVHDLAITGCEHDLDELAYRLRSRLGLPVYRRIARESPGEQINVV